MKIEQHDDLFYHVDGVTLDGVPVPAFVWADDETGEVCRYVKHDKPEPVPLPPRVEGQPRQSLPGHQGARYKVVDGPNGKEMATEVVTGAVAFVWKPKTVRVGEPFDRDAAVKLRAAIAHMNGASPA